MEKKLSVFLVLILILSSLLIGCGKEESVDTSEVKEVENNSYKDMAGRVVELPEKIEKVYTTNYVGTIFMYTFDEEKLAGISVNLTEDEKKYTSDHFQSLPVIGGTGGKGQETSPEEIINISPDIVLYFGTLDDSSVEEMDKLEEQLGIPVIMLSSDIKDTVETYRELGKIFDNEERANELSDHVEKIFSEVDNIVGDIPEEEKVKVYYASGPVGLETGVKGSSHTQSIELAGGTNIIEGDSNEDKGRVEVSIEQILKEDPELIIVAPSKSDGVSSSYDHIKTDENWQDIQAVKEGRVYETPYKPFNWFDRPPSVNRLLGIKWLTYIMYPDKVDFDIKQDAVEFYELFYNIELNNEDIEDILGNSI